MNDGVAMNCRFHVKRLGRRTNVSEGEAKSRGKAAPVPRISRLMALAIRFDGLIRDGVVTNLAALGHVSRARASQIMNLLFRR